MTNWGPHMTLMPMSKADTYDFLTGPDRAAEDYVII